MNQLVDNALGGADLGCPPKSYKYQGESYNCFMGEYSVDSGGRDCKSRVFDSAGATPASPTNTTAEQDAIIQQLNKAVFQAQNAAIDLAQQVQQLTTDRDHAEKMQAKLAAENMKQRDVMRMARGAMDNGYSRLVQYNCGMTDEGMAMVESITALDAALNPTSEPSLDKCPECGGPADNGHDRCYPPNPYCCTKCCAERE